MRQRKTAAAKKQSGAPAAGGDAASARERLLAAASDLFYRRGIRSIGVDAIIAEANVAKMSLYRSFPSKDELAAAYLRGVDERYWRRWDEIAIRHAGDPRAELDAHCRALAKKATHADWRGCPFTNAATEFPEIDHPARHVAEANKREMRRRLHGLAKAARARHAGALADQLTLLFEGAYASAQTFGPNGPATQLADAAAALLKAHLD